jgi:sentrin-specific protease 1
MNGYDCGVFACQFAQKSALDSPFDFSQKEMQDIRRQMRRDIIKKEVSLRM